MRYPTVEDLLIKISMMNLVSGEKITLICENEHGYKWKDHVFFDESSIYEPEPLGFDFFVRTQNGVSCGIIGLADWTKEGDDQNIAGIGGVWCRDVQRGWR